MRNRLTRLWSIWKEIASGIGDFQARWLLTLFYFTVAVPFALLVRLVLDPLRNSRLSRQSAWLSRPVRPSETIATATHEF